MTLGVVQFACSDDVAENLAIASRLVREAAGQGANIIVVQELFEGHYFCQEELPVHFARAKPLAGHASIAAMQALAAELGVVIPVLFFEARNQAYFNSVAIVDDRGTILGIYRKSHIPDGPGYSENSTSIRAIPAFASGRRASGRSASASAGTSGSRKPRASWR